MSFPTSLELRNQLRQFLAGQMSFRTFQQWFIPATWDIPAGASHDAVDLAGKIMLRLAEYLSHDWTREELKTMLEPLAFPQFQINDLTILFGRGNPIVPTATYLGSSGLVSGIAPPIASSATAVSSWSRSLSL